MVRVSLMNDPSAVITQVNPNDPQTTTNNHPSYTQTDVQKPRRRGCFSTLFCCFGIRRQKKNSSTTPPPPNPEPPITKAHHHLLPCKNPLDVNKKCVVIDLDETLVHSSFKPIDNADFVVPIEIDLTVHQVYVLKRPYVDEFLQKMGELYECVLFTASLAKYADPVADLLDKWGVFKARLFRDSCSFHRGNYVKDLGRLGRELKDVIIIDNSPASYFFHPENAIPVSSWFDDMDDRELLEIIPTMESIARSKDIYPIIRECAQSKQKAAPQYGNSVSIVPAQDAVGAYTITSPLPTQVAPVAVSGGGAQGAPQGTGGVPPTKPASPGLRGGSGSVIASADPHVSYVPGTGSATNAGTSGNPQGGAGIPSQLVTDLENSSIGNLDNSTSNGGTAATQVAQGRHSMTATTPVNEASFATANSSIQSSVSYVSSSSSSANAAGTSSQPVAADPSSINNSGSPFLPNTAMDSIHLTGSEAANMSNVTVTQTSPAASSK